MYKSICWVLGFFVFCCFAMGDADLACAQNSRPIVIVHGAWGGSHHWKAAADLLGQKDVGNIHRVSLTGQEPRVHLASCI